ncbi:cupin domain-containing protein [Defluviimonas sp. WL0024]|uniref:Cupin domain-containing protein n=2 Tax=Albidovulum TaxID=205889 RepID=A0ABT3J9H5_9RHOB|nr:MULTISPECIES: cupin domain-containing protein [Defluviimonas]MCU9850645.1 cupin domain-containing protein [Defluviimonas sp. WL0024]MCW3784341.1 cupin domain-containing protein [Defluviimonas salinarum]
MKIVKANTVPKEVAKGALYFGGHIDFECLAARPDSADLDIYMVNFAPGARNRLHAHRVDQILIATSGKGIVADAEGEHLMEPGDVAVIPAGHPHWHGAAADAAFSHLAISRQGDEITIVDGGDGA